MPEIDRASLLYAKSGRDNGLILGGEDLNIAQENLFKAQKKLLVHRGYSETEAEELARLNSIHEGFHATNDDLLGTKGGRIGFSTKVISNRLTSFYEADGDRTLDQHLKIVEGPGVDMSFRDKAEALGLRAQIFLRDLLNL